MHEEIWSLVQFGNGFNWKDVYFMPIHWRRFYLQRLVDYKKKESEQQQKSNTSKGNIPRPKVKVK